MTFSNNRRSHKHGGASYNPGKTYVDSKLYTQLTQFFHLNHCPPLPPVNVVTGKQYFETNLNPVIMIFNIKGERGERNILQVICHKIRAETKALIGGGGVYSCIHVLPDEFLLKSVVITVDFKRNSSGRTRIYEYTPPPQLTL